MRPSVAALRMAPVVLKPEKCADHPGPREAKEYASSEQSLCEAAEMLGACDGPLAVTGT